MLLNRIIKQKILILNFEIKLVNRDLKKGETIDITIDNKYNVNNYKGKKKIVLSNATRFGGKNKFLGVSYIVVGALSILCAILFPIGYQFQLKKEKDSN